MGRSLGVTFDSENSCVDCKANFDGLSDVDSAMEPVSAWTKVTQSTPLGRINEPSLSRVAEPAPDMKTSQRAHRYHHQPPLEPSDPAGLGSRNRQRISDTAQGPGLCPEQLPDPEGQILPLSTPERRQGLTKIRPFGITPRMMSTPSYLKNDVILVRNPFSDLSSVKVRPAVAG
jgi:hypothetical protein